MITWYICPSPSPSHRGPRGGLWLPGARGRLAAQAEPRAVADLAGGGACADAGGTGEATGDLEEDGHVWCLLWWIY